MAKNEMQYLKSLTEAVRQGDQERLHELLDEVCSRYDLSDPRWDDDFGFTEEDEVAMYLRWRFDPNAKGDSHTKSGWRELSPTERRRWREEVRNLSTLDYWRP